MESLQMKLSLSSVASTAMKLPRQTCIASICVMIALFAALVPKLFGQLQGGFNPDLDYRSGSQPWPKAVHAFVVQPNGKLVVAADSKLIRLNTDGSKDAVLFDLAVTVNASGSAMETQADGKILVGLSYVSGSPSRLIRLNADGSLDAGFNVPRDPTSGTYGWITAIAVAADGIIYIADRFEGGHVRIFKLNPNGSTIPIPEFWPLTVSGGSAGALPVEDLLIDAGGKLVVAGAVTSTNLPTTRDFFRVNNDGGLDTTFTPPDFNNGWVNAVVQRSDGKFIAGGTFTVTNGTDIRQGLARFNTDGSLDGAYNTGSGSGITALALLPDDTTIIGAQSNGTVGRSNANGVADSSWVIQSVPGDGAILSVAILPDGSVYANGTSLKLANSGIMNLVRFRPNGVPDVPASRFDYDSDYIADLTVYRPSNRIWYTQTAQNYTVFEFGFATDEPVPADYDGDAKTDIAVWRPSNGTWYWINSSNITFSALQWGQDGDVPMAGNVAWDRKAPFTVYRPSSGTWYRLEGTAYRINVLQFGAPGDIPLHGRYLNRVPFQSTPTLYRPSTRQFIMAVWEVPGTIPGALQWGQVGDVPVCGDFDGDFITDLAVYRPSNGRWEIRRSSVNNNPTLALYAWNWGQPGDVPVVADYNGDLRDDIAVFRPSNGEWYIIHSPNAVNQPPTSFVTRTFGVDGDRPVPAAYLP
jgi:uncharacterized delta-60 repeat protein